MTTSPMRRFRNRLTGRRPASAAPVKPWVRATCGQTHDALSAVTFPAPLAWDQASEQERADDFDLTTDTCIWKDEGTGRCTCACPPRAPPGRLPRDPVSPKLPRAPRSPAP